LPSQKRSWQTGQWIRNSNGSYDVGQMQFNTNYLADLAHYGITANDVAAPAATLSTWRHGGLGSTYFMIQAIFDAIS